MGYHIVMDCHVLANKIPKNMMESISNRIKISTKLVGVWKSFLQPATLSLVLLALENNDQIEVRILQQIATEI